MKRIRVSVVALVIAMGLCCVCGCGRTVEEKDAIETSSNIDNTNEPEDDKTDDIDTTEDTDRDDSGEDKADFDKAEEIDEDGDYICHYCREELNGEGEALSWYLSRGISEAFIEDGYLYIAGALAYQGIYTGEEDEDGFPIILGFAKDYENGVYRIKLADEVTWGHYWFTNGISMDNLIPDSNNVSRIEPQLKVEDIQNAFNVIFDKSAPDYMEQYTNPVDGHDGGCTLSFTIKDGKVVRLSVCFPVG